MPRPSINCHSKNIVGLPFEGAFYRGRSASLDCVSLRFQPNPDSIFSSQISHLESVETVSWNACKWTVAGVERFVNSFELHVPTWSVLGIQDVWGGKTT